MAIQLKSSIGTPTANSYVSVASANTYFDERSDSEAWQDLVINSSGTLTATKKKESLLIQATREIDRTYRFFGTKDNVGLKGADDYQNLEFPREGVDNENVDTNGNPIIPDDIKFATYEQAIWILQRNATQTSEEGETIKNPQFSDLAYTHLRKWVQRQVQGSGKWPWE